jgi:hypothetical protein
MSIILGLSVFFVGNNGSFSDKEIDKIELVKFEFEDKVYERRLSIDGNFFTVS